MTTETLSVLQDRLNNQIQNGEWRKILLTLAIVGVADNQQLIDSTGLNRDKLRRTLDKMSAISVGGAPLFNVFSKRIRRGSKRGVTPKVFRLSERGAALCKLNGITDARACKLEEERSVSHALGILDVRLLATACGLNVVTDSNLRYNQEKFIRPDNLLTLASGHQAIFESEQDANSDYIERILKSIEHKIAFYDSEAARNFSPVVRMLVDLPEGKLYNKTLDTWRQAMEIRREVNGGSLNFCLVAMSLENFLANPDWNQEPDERWVDLTKGTQEANPLDNSLAELAQSVPQMSTFEQRLIIAAMQKNVANYCDACRKNNSTDPIEFLYLMRDICSYSYGRWRSLSINQSGPTWLALFLLDQYLKMNPELYKILQETIVMDSRRIHWNQTMALHRMQVVIDAFLEYHGWRADGALQVYPFTPDYQTRGPRRLSVAVEITNPAILRDNESQIEPTESEIREIEKSLAWVLTAFFSHYAHLGLKKAPFW